MSRIFEQVFRSAPALIDGAAVADFPVVVRADQAREEDRSMPVVVATEKPLPGYDRNYELVDQLLLMADDNLPVDGVTFIDSHYAFTVENTLGSVRDWAFENGTAGRQLVGRIYFADTQRGRDTFANYRAGHLSDVSIRAYATESVLRVEPGKTGTVGDRTFTAGARPLDVFVRWSVYEVSAVVRGKDVDAKVRRAAELRRYGMDFEKWLALRGLSVEGLDEARRTSLHAQFVKEQEEAARGAAPSQPSTPAPQVSEPQGVDAGAVNRTIEAVLEKVVPAAVNRAMDAAAKAETERVTRIREICNGEMPEVERQAIAERWSPEKTSEEALKAVRSRMDSGVGAPAIIVKGGEFTERSLEDALRVKGGHGDDIVREDKEHGEERANRADDLRDLTLIDVCRQALALDGKQVPHRREDMIRAATSTITLPKILGAVANKSVMKGYMLAASTWRPWCSVGSVSDFKANTGVRLTDVGDLEEVSQPAGNIRDGGLSEEYEQYTLARYAKKVVIGETQIINDDLGMLTKVPQGMGNRAGSLVSKLVYTHLLANGTMADGVALFHATHSNLVTGAGYKLSAGAAALRKALETLRKQKNSDNEPIDVQPRVVLCAPEDEEYARALLRSITLAEGTTAGLATANIWGSMGMVPVVESRLSNSNYTGYSTTAWYLIGDPAAVDTVQVSFLNGNQAPRVEFFNAMQMGIDTIGVGYRVIMDAVAKALDYRGMVKLTGE